jgi:hypothetical protein
MTTDPVMVEIDRANRMGAAGELDEARSLLGRLWDEAGEGGDPLHRCSIAHSMADLQADPADELEWDTRALVAAAEVSDERAAEAGLSSGRRGLFPSLHLNLADVHRRLGQIDLARRHVEAGRSYAGSLGDDGYGRMIGGALDRLAGELGPG